MRILFLLLGIGAAFVHSFAQSPLRKATQAMKYHIVSESGRFACALTYNPKTELYYTAFAGNSKPPLEVFDNKGQNKYSAEVGIDLRSLWINLKKNLLQGLAYPQKGKFSINIEKNGMPSVLKEPKNDSILSIPNKQSVAFYTGKVLYFFDGKLVYVLNALSLKLKSTFGLKNIPGDMDNLNSTSVVYTGKKGYELAFYDSFEGKVYFTDSKGNYTGTSLLPDTAPSTSTFSFSYANNMIWLYDAKERNWYAYSVFN